MSAATGAEHPKTLSGLELVQRTFAAGGFGRGIGRTMAMSGQSAEFGEVVLSGVPTEDHYNPFGNVHGGYGATMLDAAIALAVQTTLPPGAGCATVDLKVTYLRPMTKESGPVVARGKVIHAGSRIVASEGWLMDRDGKLCAHGTATCMIMVANTGAVSGCGGKLEV